METDFNKVNNLPSALFQWVSKSFKDNLFSLCEFSISIGTGHRWQMYFFFMWQIFRFSDNEWQVAEGEKMISLVPPR